LIRLYYLRRPTGITGEAGDFYIALRELQVWIGGSNVLQSSGLESLFVNWAVDKEVDLGALGGGSINDASKLYDNVISNEYDAHSKEGNSTSDIALIIKGLSLTIIESIQALTIEFYNSTQDPTFTEILGTTSVITTADDVYRFDFPDIATYSVFSTGESLTNIIREEDATSEVVSVAESPTEMVGGLSVDTITTTGNVDISGNLVVGTTNIIDEIGTKQDEMTIDTDLTCNTLNTSGDITTTGYLNDKAHKYFISGKDYDLDGITTFDLRTNEEYLSDFVTHNGSGTYQIQNITSSKLCMITIACSVSSDVYDSGISWRLTLFRNGSNFPAFGKRYCFTNGASSLQSETVLVARVFTYLANNLYFNFVIDQDRGTGAYGEVMDGSKVLSGVSIYFQIVG